MFGLVGVVEAGVMLRRCEQCYQSLNFRSDCTQTLAQAARIAAARDNDIVMLSVLLLGFRGDACVAWARYVEEHVRLAVGNGGCADAAHRRIVAVPPSSPPRVGPW